jgi:hypothetical protein
MRVWFANLILYSEALTLARAYAPFADIGAAVLQMPANIGRVRVAEGCRAGTAMDRGQIRMRAERGHK